MLENFGVIQPIPRYPLFIDSKFIIGSCRATTTEKEEFISLPRYVLQNTMHNNDNASWKSEMIVTVAYMYEPKNN